jgi:hypothetical protein
MESSSGNSRASSPSDSLAKPPFKSFTTWEATSKNCGGGSLTTTTTTTTSTAKRKIKVKLSNNTVSLTSKKRRSYEIISPKIFSSYTSEVQIEKNKAAQLETSCSNHYDGLIDDHDLLESTPCSDALLAMKALIQRHQYGVVGTHNVPFVLRNMIHAVMMGSDEKDVGASTAIGQELELLLQQGQIRMIRLFTSSSGTNSGGAITLGQDVAVFEESLFIKEVQRILLGCNNLAVVPMQEYDRVTLADRFIHSLQMIHKMYVSEADLINCMASYFSSVSTNSNQNNRIPILDWKKDIHELVLAGLLLPKPQTHCLSLGASSSPNNNNNTIYYLTLPGIGEASRSIDLGRADMLLRIKRSMRKEIKQTTLLSKPIKNSSFSPIFHLKDLLSTGKLVLSRTPCGFFVKLGTS